MAWDSSVCAFGDLKSAEAKNVSAFPILQLEIRGDGLKVMITIIHGEDVASSRKKLNDEKKKYEDREIFFFDGAKITIEEIILPFESRSLFKKNKLIIIENLLTGKIGKDKEEVIKFIVKKRSDLPVIIWAGKEIGKRVLHKYFPKAKSINCQYPKILFKFLDSLGTVPAFSALESFHKLLKQKEPEIIFSLLIRQFRYLIIVKDSQVADIPFLQAWQIGKFKRQASHFSFSELISAYRNLLSIDAKIKLGKSPLNLEKHLDIFFSSL